MLLEDEFAQYIKAWSEQPREEKDAFYEVFLWPEVRRRFMHQPAPEHHFDVLIIPISNPYTALLHLEYYRPTTAVLLYTERSRRDHATQLRQAVSELGIICDDSIDDVAPNDALTVYRAVKRAYERYNNAHIAIDITGGTKVMSTGAAMAGSVIGADIVYIESKFDQSIQDRSPGTEQSHHIPDPYITLGDIQRQRAFSSYNAHDYVTAATLFNDLAQRVRPSQGDEHWAKLSEAYAAWDAFDLQTAAQHMIALVDKLKCSDTPAMLRAADAHLRTQARLLSTLAVVAVDIKAGPPLTVLNDLDRVLTLMGSLYQNARRCEAQSRFDIAALLLYRCLELISQRRLARFGISTSKPRYERVLTNVSDLAERYAQTLCNKAERTGWICRNKEFEEFATVVEEILQRFFIVERRNFAVWQTQHAFLLHLP